MPTCLIGLGSNLGNRRAILTEAVGQLRDQVGVKVLRQSGWHKTRPVGGPPGQGPFLNAAVCVETTLPPEVLLLSLQGIELALGRRRAERWGPRRVDLDLLLYDQLVLETPAVSLPHPRMAWRRFVLEPAAEVAASMIHPTTGWSVGQLLDHLDSAAPYLAIGGPAGVANSDLARRLGEATSAELISRPAGSVWPEAFPPNPSGNVGSGELEFLEAMVRLLDRDAPRWTPPDRLQVSDFWFDQSMAWAEVSLAGYRLDDFRRRWEEARPKVVCPKLTVVLDLPVDRRKHSPNPFVVPRFIGAVRRDPAKDRMNAVTTTCDGRWDRLRQSVLRWANTPGQGPVLRLVGDDRSRVLTEVLAAVDSMNA